MVLQRQGTDPMTTLTPVVDRSALAQMQQIVAETYLSQDIAAYIVDLVDATRRSSLLLRGVSPRATLALASLAKAIACLRGRDYVVPKDVQECFVTAFSHRIRVSSEADGQGMDSQAALKAILGKVAAPRLN
jgi:MoxR-like ATPase